MDIWDTIRVPPPFYLVANALWCDCKQSRTLNFTSKTTAEVAAKQKEIKDRICRFLLLSCLEHRVKEIKNLRRNQA